MNALPLPRLAALCALTAGLAIVALHFLRRDLNPLHRFVSEYAVDGDGSRCGWLMQAVFLLLAACAALLALTHPGPSRIALAFAAAGTLVMFACRTDLNVAGAARTRAGKIHDTSAVLTFPMLVGAMLLLAYETHSPAMWLFFAVAGATLAVQFLLTLTQKRPYRGLGITERLLIATMLGWCVWVWKSQA